MYFTGMFQVLRAFNDHNEQPTVTNRTSTIVENLLNFKIRVYNVLDKASSIIRLGDLDIIPHPIRSFEENSPHDLESYVRNDQLRTEK